MNTKNDKWLKIKDFSNYEISDTGKVKRLEREVITKSGNTSLLKEKIMSATISYSGYEKISLTRDKKLTSFRIHRLVAEHFIPNPENKPQINHIDGNKTNNHASNLEWCTPLENITHAFETGLVPSREGESNCFSKLTEREVLQIRHLFQTNVFDMEELSKKYKVTNKTIFNIVTRRAWTHI